MRRKKMEGRNGKEEARKRQANVLEEEKEN
jgi:hypothetical protein